MRMLPLILRRLMCRHDWGPPEFWGFENDGGRFRTVRGRSCHRCGKLERVP